MQIDVVFTGEHPSIVRPVLKEMAEDKGIKVRGNFWSKTNLVVASYDAAKNGTVKFSKAHEKGVRVITYGQFEEEFLKGNYQLPLL